MRIKLLHKSQMAPGMRERLGKIVRMAWVNWAKQQPDPKPSWLVPWYGLDEKDKEADRQIGELVYRYSAYASGLPGPDIFSVPHTERKQTDFDNEIEEASIINFK